MPVIDYVHAAEEELFSVLKCALIQLHQAKVCFIFFCLVYLCILIKDYFKDFIDILCT